jgi:hypothetical protein
MQKGNLVRLNERGLRAHTSRIVDWKTRVGTIVGMHHNNQHVYVKWHHNRSASDPLSITALEQVVEKVT